MQKGVPPSIVSVFRQRKIDACRTSLLEERWQKIGRTQSGVSRGVESSSRVESTSRVVIIVVPSSYCSGPHSLVLAARAQTTQHPLAMKFLSAVTLLAGSAAAFAPAPSGKFDIFVFVFHHLVLSLEALDAGEK